MRPQSYGQWHLHSAGTADPSCFKSAKLFQKLFQNGGACTNNVLLDQNQSVVGLRCQELLALKKNSRAFGSRGKGGKGAELGTGQQERNRFERRWRWWQALLPFLTLLPGQETQHRSSQFCVPNPEETWHSFPDLKVALEKNSIGLWLSCSLVSAFVKEMDAWNMTAL